MNATRDLILTNRKRIPFSLAGSARMENGVPVQRFLKELIRVGSYVKASDNLEFQVTPDVLDHWAATFSLMRDNGVRVPVPVAHTTDVEKNRGWMVDCYVDGQSLYGVFDLVGEDAIALAGRSDVSIYSPAEYVDGKGYKYARPILHVALCTDPVIPGLNGFVAIAASQVPVLILENTSMADLNTPANIDPSPKPASGGGPDTTGAIKEAFKQAIIQVLEDTAADEKSMILKIRDIIKARGKALGLLEVSSNAPAAVAGGAVAASHSSDPMLIKLARKSRQQDLNQLASQGKITPAARDKLAAQWVGDDTTLSLSISEAGIAQFDNLIAALSENTAVILGEKTRGQTLSLSSPLKEGEDPYEKTMKAAAGIK